MTRLFRAQFGRISKKMAEKGAKGSRFDFSAHRPYIALATVANRRSLVLCGS